CVFGVKKRGGDGVGQGLEFRRVLFRSADLDLAAWLDVEGRSGPDLDGLQRRAKRPGRGRRRYRAGRRSVHVHEVHPHRRWLSHRSEERRGGEEWRVWVSRGRENEAEKK